MKSKESKSKSKKNYVLKYNKKKAQYNISYSAIFQIKKCIHEIKEIKIKIKKNYVLKHNEKKVQYNEKKVQ